MPCTVTRGGTTTTLTYDGDGVRVKKVAGGTTTYYISSDYEIKNGTHIKFIFAGNLRVAEIEGSTATIFHKDHLGSSTAMTNSTAGEIETSEYMPFGGMREHTGTEVSDYKFTDQELDKSSNLYNYDARLYDPVIGRFISADSEVPDFIDTERSAVHDPQKLNRYAYCFNNPLFYTDPSGHIVVINITRGMSTDRTTRGTFIAYSTITGNMVTGVTLEHARYTGAYPLAAPGFYTGTVQDKSFETPPRYIHLNPVRAKIVEFPEEYEWSSYSYYIGNKKYPEWLRIDFILGYFGKKLSEAQKIYKKFVGEMIDKQYESPLKDVVSSTLLGTQEFINFIKDKYLSGQKDDKDLPALKTLKREISIDNISEEVDKAVKEDKKLSRNIKIYLCRRLTGKRLDDIGTHFEIGSSGVCQASRRIAAQLKKDKALERTLKKIENKLSIMKV